MTRGAERLVGILGTRGAVGSRTAVKTRSMTAHIKHLT